MGFTITEIVLLSIFVLCIIIGVIGTKILAHKRNKLSDIDDFDNETLSIEQISEEETDISFNDMAESMLSSKDYRDKDEDFDDYIEY